MKKKYKKLSPLMLSALSAGLAVLGFGSCGSSRVAIKEKEQNLTARLDHTLAEESRLTSLYQELTKRRDEVIRMGRGVCVYGGPNMSREEVNRIVREAEERANQEAADIEERMKDVSHQLDSISDVKRQTYNELEKLKQKK